MRLDKFLSNNSRYSRNEVGKLIRQGRVDLNGLSAMNPSQQVDTDRDAVKLDAKLVCPSSNSYIMLNKPLGYVCTNQDGGHPTVLDLLAGKMELPAGTLQIAGRLDIDTTGLVLLTTDGHWNHAITAPGKRCGKQYYVETESPIEIGTIQSLRNGLLLHNETKPTLPAEIEKLSENSARLTIYEGRYHQIKRMFAACNNHVVKLHRQAIGHITLDSTLQLGEFRHLAAEERDLSE